MQKKLYKRGIFIKNRLKRHYDLEDVKIYLRKKAIAQKVIRRVQYEYWFQYCRSLNRFTEVGKVWEQVKRMRESSMNNHLFHNLTTNGCTIEDSKEKADAMATFFKSVDDSFSLNDCNDVCTESLNGSSKKVDGDCINDNFKMIEMMNVLNEMKNCSPGKDDIYTVMIKNLSKNAMIYLLNMYNDIWKTSYFPQQWYEVIQIPILKSGKDSTQVTSYRPISLLSTLFKIMEKMVKHRLTWYLEKHQLLNPFQSGFCKNRNVKDNLMRLETDIHISLKTKKYTVAIFLDLEKAYDSLWKDGLFKKLASLGLCGRMLMFMKSFLMKRLCYVRINNCFSRNYELDNGIPQGSSLSPLLFSLMLIDLDIKETDVKLSCYADDIAIWYSCSDLEQARRKIQNALYELEIWFWKWKLNVSPTKSAVLVFTNRQKRDIVLKIKGCRLPIHTQYKFLGLLLDSKLTWKAHINHIVNKCKKRLNLLRCVSGTPWGCKYEILMMVYKGLILSILDYGCELYDSACTTLKKKLDSIQYRALKIITGTIHDVSLSALQALTGELPLNHRRRFLCDKFKLYLMSSNSNHPTREVFSDDRFTNMEWKEGEGPFKFRSCIDTVDVECKTDLLSRLPEWQLIRPRVTFELHEKIVKKEMQNDEMKLIALESIHKTWKGYLHIYTDGSKLEDGRTGAAFYVCQYKVTKHFRTSHICIMRAELVAILMALNWMNANIASSSVVIFTDSLSALQIINSYFIRCGIVNEILSMINSLRVKDVFVDFQWIPSHCGIVGNEIVDRAAKNGALKRVVDIKISNTTYEVTATRLIDFKKIWQTEWNDPQNHGRFLHALHNNVTKPIHIKGLSRREDCLIQQLRVGKCRLNFYLFQIQQHDTGLCELCGEPETVEHFLLQCQKYNVERSLLKRRTNLKDPNLKNLLISDTSVIHEVLRYIQETKRFK